MTGPGFVPFERAWIEQSLHSRFRRIVELHGERPAVCTAAGALSYRRLDAWASAIGARLRGGSVPGDPVAVLVGQELSLPAAVLGVLSAGSFYVPLDPAGPEERLRLLVGQSGARLAVVGPGTAMLARRLGLEPIEVGEPPVGAPAPSSVETAPGALAYLFFTSGTTGPPKGVADRHRNVLHNVMRYTNGLEIGPGDRLTLLQRACFSGSVSSLFSALLNGASVFPFDPSGAGPEALARYVADNRITIWHSVPALFRRLAGAGSELPSLRVVRLEGDAASVRDAQAFRARFPRTCVLVNGLGATECGLVRRHVVDHTTALEGAALPVGKAVADMEVVVLDPAGRELPAGEVGEIAVRSEYLAPGYWRRPDLTAARFLADPGDGSGRTYLTGDLGRMRADGTLEHLGRTDFEVKVRGSRVEVEAIERTLVERGLAAEAVVAVCPRADGSPRVVAYLVPAGPAPTVGALRRALAGTVPAASIPSDFVLLDGLPLTENAKLDRAALPAPDGARPRLDIPYVPPRDHLEAELAGLFEDVLGVRPVGIRDDFLELGGDSLLAAELLAAWSQRAGREPPFSLLAANGTVETLAGALALAREREGERNATVRVVREGAGPPLVLAHGDHLAGGLFCRRLAPLLGRGRGLVAVDPHGHGAEPVPWTVEEMAHDRVLALRELQPSGPYLLAGHCQLGGLVAYEMARTLAAEGERIGALALIGTTPPNVTGAAAPAVRRLRRGCMRAAELAGLDPRAGHTAFLRLRGAYLAAAAVASLERPPVLVPAWRRRTRLEQLLAATTGYVPGPYERAVTLLWPEQDRVCTPAAAAARWRRVASGVEVRVVPGDHLSCVGRHVEALGAALRDAIADALSGPAARGRRPPAGRA